MHSSLGITIKLLQQRWLCSVAKGLLTLTPFGVAIRHCWAAFEEVRSREGVDSIHPFLGFFWVQMCIPLAPMHYNHLGLQIRLVDAVFQELLRQFSGVTWKIGAKNGGLWTQWSSSHDTLFDYTRFHSHFSNWFLNYFWLLLGYFWYTFGHFR